MGSADLLPWWARAQECDGLRHCGTLMALFPLQNRCEMLVQCSGRCWGVCVWLHRVPAPMDPHFCFTPHLLCSSSLKRITKQNENKTMHELNYEFI